MLQQQSSVAQQQSQDAATAQKQQLMGSGPNSLNLAAIRARVQELKKSLDEVVFALSHGQQSIYWPNVLERMSIINVQFLHMMEQVRPILKQYVVHPKFIDTPKTAEVLPIQLATRQLPEMDAADNNAMAEWRERLASHSVEAQYNVVSESMEAFNVLVDALVTVQAGQASTGPLDPRGPLREEVTRTSKAIAAAVSAADSARSKAQAAGGIAPASAPLNKRQAAARRKKEGGSGNFDQLLGDIISGKSFTDKI